MPLITVGPVTLNICESSNLEEAIAGRIARRIPSQIVTFNALMFYSARRDDDFASIVTSSLSLIDSVGMAWAVRFLTGKSVERVPGIDVVDRLCRLSQASGFTVFLLGARPGVASAAADALRNRFPGLKIAGTHHGYFTKAEEARLINTVRTSCADILLVAMATPHQEKWIAAHLQELAIPAVIGVGGSFDVISGNLTRSPGWMQRWGLEWLFRLLQQPWRITRIFRLLFFVWNVVRLKLKLVVKSPLRT